MPTSHCNVQSPPASAATQLGRLRPPATTPRPPPPNGREEQLAVQLQHVDIRLTAEDGYQAQRSYSIASAPAGTASFEVAVTRIDLSSSDVRRRIRDARINRLYFAISVDVITYPDPIKTVDVPGATTQPPSITPEQKRQSDKMEPKQVIALPTPTGP